VRADVSTHFTAATVNVVGRERRHWTRTLAANHAHLGPTARWSSWWTSSSLRVVPNARRSVVCRRRSRPTKIW